MEESKGTEVYDDTSFFERYISLRNRKTSANELLERPIIEELVGDVGGKDIFDIGCGDGRYGKFLFEKGAKFYCGVDASQNMLKLAAKNLEGKHHKLEHAAIEKYNFPFELYDLVVSRLALHYIEDLVPTFRGVHKALKENGALVFSVEHPIITSCYDAYKSKGKRQHWVVDHYFDSGKRINTWLGKEVVKYHKTIEEYFALVKSTGFVLEELRESKPQSAYFENPEEYERRKRIPLFLMFKLKKTGLSSL